MVRTNTIVLPGCDAAVLRIKGTEKAIAIKLDGNPRYCYLDPRRGAMIAVAESCRNLTCTGAQLLAATNCLNFGSPENPEVMWQFSETIDGMAEACRFFGTPITGGNVSFYNETLGRAIYPTPVIGLVGLIENVSHITTAPFKDEGDVIVLIGQSLPELGGTQYLESTHGLCIGLPPALDLRKEQLVQHACNESILRGLIKSAHDCAEGGLAVAMAECCLLRPSHPVGCRIEMSSHMRPDALLFGETQSRILVTTIPDKLGALTDYLAKTNVPFQIIGNVGGSQFSFILNGVKLISLSAVELHAEWSSALERRLLTD
jgi:phosphoribosylformylglycinamidine synthase